MPHQQQDNTVKTLGQIATHRMVITCANCKTVKVHDIANLILVMGDQATPHDVRQRSVCPSCGTRGNNIYRITDPQKDTP